MSTWQHSGFSVDQSMLPCPFRLSRLVKISEMGQVVYKAEKQSRRAFPYQNGDGMQSSPK